MKPMMSLEMRQALVARLEQLDASPKISLVGPDLRAETVEDAERLVARFTSWLDVFYELGEASTLASDRAAFERIYVTFDKLLADLKTAIHAARACAVPWEETRNILSYAVLKEPFWRTT